MELRTNTRVLAIEPGKVCLAEETIAADTIVLAAGTAAHPILARLPVEKDKQGRIMVEPTMRCRSQPEVWALGDCASVPGPDRKPYPSLAQHALREAPLLAENLFGAISGRPPKPFVYHSLGMMGSLGRGDGFGQFLGVRLRGFPAFAQRRPARASC